MLVKHEPFVILQSSDNSKLARWAQTEVVKHSSVWCIGWACCLIHQAGLSVQVDERQPFSSGWPDDGMRQKKIWIEQGQLLWFVKGSNSHSLPKFSMKMDAKNFHIKTTHLATCDTHHLPWLTLS